MEEANNSLEKLSSEHCSMCKILSILESIVVDLNLETEVKDCGKGMNKFSLITL